MESSGTTIIRAIGCAATAWALGMLPAQAMSVDEAYASIPHQRTPFSAAASTTSPAQSAALARLFDLSDQATVVRVRALAALRARDAGALREALRDYRAPLDGLRQVPAEPALRQAQALVLGAVQLHLAFYEARLAAGLRDASFSPEVHRASGQLRQAYSLLMAAFPRETPRNRQAYFDHLCALDFL